MTVLYPEWTNRVGPMIAAGALVGLIGCVTIVDRYFSPWNTDVGYAPDQPVPYSHKLHAGTLGIDCRYCHQKVESGPHATIPSSETCISCHDRARIKGNSKRLAPVRDNFYDGKPLEWVRVHMLPEYAYFDHSVHLNAGVGCASCHGRIDRMEVVRQAKPLSMGWCISCHRAPERHLRPRDKVTDMTYLHADAYEDPEFSADVEALRNAGKDVASMQREALATGMELKQQRGLNTTDRQQPQYPPTHCSACHR